MSDQILIGTQLVVPNDYLNLRVGIIYYFLTRTHCVRLIEFVVREPVRIGKTQRIERPPAEVILIEMGDEYFDVGLEQGLIILKPYQEPLPEWCEGIEKSNRISSVKGKILNPDDLVLKHQTRIIRTLNAYKEIIDNALEIIKLPNPFTYLNEFARNSNPQQNGKRLRCEFFAYILHKYDERIIGYQWQRIGKWPRDGHLGKKAGVKSLGIGNQYQFKSSDEKIQCDIREAWKRWGIYGMSIKSIYRKLCAHIWKTKALSDEKGLKIQIRENGEPFLTYGQFRARIYSLFGQINVREKLSGYAYVREEILPSTGKFSQSVISVGERTEADGYWVEEIVIGPDGKTPLPTLIVVRIVCTTSGMYLGIGFSLDGEKASAYRMALFCMAIRKSIFGRLIGLPIDDESWPSHGLCDDAVTDRGAGGGNKGKASQPVGNSAIHSMPPTGFGQGKATVESSHPRGIPMRDRPAHWVTSLSLIDLVRREVQATVSLNDARDMSGRLTPSMLSYIDRTTPLDIFTKLSSRGRNNLRPITFDQAVRSFLTPVELTVKPDGVYHRYQRYVSDDLFKLGILQVVTTTGQEFKLQGFMLDMSTRYCFLDWHGELIELDGVLALREDDDQLFISLHQIEEANHIIKKMKSDFKVHSEAVKVEGMQEFVEKTGTSPEKITVKSGAGKRRKAAGQFQSKMIKSILSHKNEKE
jgi:hypothetical protein